MNRKYMLWLSSVPGIGLIRIRKLIAYFGSPEEVWNSSYSDLLNVYGIGEKTARSVIEWRDSDRFNSYMKYLQDNNIKVLFKDNEGYPKSLLNIHSPPEILYIRGNLDVNSNPSIAIVGSRKATYYGKNMAEKFAYELASVGITIISGMARGIDTYAHKGAIAAKGKTIAVLGTGVNIIYPSENSSLYYNIIKNGGVVSEFALGTQPLSGNFPIRNRIISGLSIGVLVIEAGERSGSLITVDYALEQGRDVFALPGNINSKYSIGTNNLIKQGAKLISNYKEILEEFCIKEYYNIYESTHINNNSLSKDEIRILRTIEDQGANVDYIVQHTGLAVAKVNGILTALEIKGLIVQQSAKIYTKC